MSVNFPGLTYSSSLTSPIALLIAAFIDTLVLSYFLVFSRFRGWEEWLVVFSVLYIGNYVLTSMEAFYLTSLLTANTVESIFVNGAIISGVFAFALVRLLTPKQMQNKMASKRLAMSRREWTWKILASGAVYLLLFILVGFAIYGPIATQLDHAAYVSEQASIPASAAGLVFPLEFLRGIFWTILAIVVTVSLSFTWKKTALVAGLLLAVPMSFSIFLSTTIVPALQVAHFVELFVENLIFGLAAVWILQLYSRLTALTSQKTKTSVSVQSSS